MHHADQKFLNPISEREDGDEKNKALRSDAGRRNGILAVLIGQTYNFIGYSVYGKENGTVQRPTIRSFLNISSIDIVTGQ